MQSQSVAKMSLGWFEMSVAPSSCGTRSRNSISVCRPRRILPRVCFPLAEETAPRPCGHPAAAIKFTECSSLGLKQEDLSRTCCAKTNNNQQKQFSIVCPLFFFLRILFMFFGSNMRKSPCTQNMVSPPEIDRLHAASKGPREKLTETEKEACSPKEVPMSCSRMCTCLRFPLACSIIDPHFFHAKNKFLLLAFWCEHLSIFFVVPLRNTSTKVKLIETTLAATARTKLPNVTKLREFLETNALDEPTQRHGAVRDITRSTDRACMSEAEKHQRTALETSSILDVVGPDFANAMPTLCSVTRDTGGLVPTCAILTFSSLGCANAFIDLRMSYVVTVLRTPFVGDHKVSSQDQVNEPDNIGNRIMEIAETEAYAPGSEPRCSSWGFSVSAIVWRLCNEQGQSCSWPAGGTSKFSGDNRNY